ncbi:MAG: hypothetical protein HGB19_01580 [Chlorobiales bacterium]|nr:hypothetical protein [Chlorobiales bacterium]
MTRKTTIALVTLVLTLLYSDLSEAKADRKKLLIAWWNVENLFDTVNDPGNGDDEFTPDGSKEWTENRLNTKLENLTEVIRDIGKSRPNDGIGLPDIMGFCEVEHLSPIKELFQKHLGTSDYGFVYYESLDPRGIDIGFAYNKEKLSVLRSEKHTVTLSGKPTRDIISVTFTYEGKPLYVIGNHWPSRLGGEMRSASKRADAAKALRGVVDSILKKEPNADILILGDFNDEPGDRSITDILQASGDMETVKNASDGHLYNCWAAYPGIGSSLYRKSWLRIDQAIVSRGMLDQRNFFIEKDSFTCFYKDYMFEKPSGRRKSKDLFRTYQGKRYEGGYSDHLPITVLLSISK